MPLPWPEIRDKAIAFSREWQDAESERAEVYNNFPWPNSPSEKQVLAIMTSAQAMLDARLQFPDASLADLYNANTMPRALMKAHQGLDGAVDASYGKKSLASDAERVAFLFELYQKYTSLLPSQSKAGKSRQKQKMP